MEFLTENMMSIRIRGTGMTAKFCLFQAVISRSILSILLLVLLNFSVISLPKCINTDCSAIIATQVVLLLVDYSNIVLFPIWFWIKSGIYIVLLTEDH